MRYFLSYLALLPAAILCYLPVIHHVRVRKTLLILGGIPLFFFLGRHRWKLRHPVPCGILSMACSLASTFRSCILL